MITVDELVPGTYRPHRQAIVVAHPTVEYRLRQNSLLVRRVIAIPGDTVSCYGTGPLMLNGAALSEPYLHKGDIPGNATFDVKIPADCLWLLGDHRNIALDCRYHVSDAHHGAIPIANVVGIVRRRA